MSGRASPGSAGADLILNLYIAVFLAYMFLPLAVMVAAAFNAYPVPSVTEWRGFSLQWFPALFSDQRLLKGLWNSVVVSSAVVLLSLPLGLAGALVLARLNGLGRTLLYTIVVTPILTPGLVLGISTLVFWRNFNVNGGLFLAVLAQSSFIAAYAMLMFMARLQRAEPALAEAALDLGASHWLVFRRVTLPFLAPTIASAALISFIQAFENYNTTVFSIGGESTFVTEIGSRFRFGLTPAINAAGVIFVVLTVVAAVAHAVLARRSGKTA